MSGINMFWRNREGSLRESVTIFAMVVSVLSVGAAMGLDRLTREGGLPRLVFLPPEGQIASKIAELNVSSAERGSNGQALDDSPVGSIPSLAQSVRLNPCTGASE